MSTSLYLITNTTFSDKNDSSHFDRILDRINLLCLAKGEGLNDRQEIIRESGAWHYRIEAECLDCPFEVVYEGPYAYWVSLFSNVSVIGTIYRYSLLYTNYDLKFFEAFRKDIWEIVTCLGGSEVIYLADNACDKLSGYLEGLAWENTPYEAIKEKMILEMGEPVRDYKKLAEDKLDYRNINEYFLDDFSDLKIPGRSN